MDDKDLLKFVFEHVGEIKTPLENTVARIEVIDDHGEVKTHLIKDDPDSKDSKFEKFRKGLKKIAKKYIKEE